MSSISKSIDFHIYTQQNRLWKTTKAAFVTRLLAERLTASQNFTLSLLILDKSEVFNIIDRTILLNNLRTILIKEKPHLIWIMLEKEKMICSSEEESKFL